ncbi:hypothetical protein PIB30_017572 [Stylosanthes scabra]|uniref:F-box protein n=1 Tax=Stylosanthes scabra TaxID=79078 RepID=A0ABU6T9C3_9FABA|nr:hypothetical protein [Stylosanthes scabra]
MSSLQLASSCYCSNNIKPKHYSSTISLKRINCAINVPKAASSTRKLVDQGLHKFKETTPPLFDNNKNDNIIKILHDNEDSMTRNTKIIHELYAVLEAVSDRIEMHNNMKEQRDNWNTLLLNSINMITLTASTMAGVAATTTGHGSSFALELSSALLFSAATGMLLVMNKIQPSQLAEEQRNATRLFKQLHSQIQTTIIALKGGEEGDEVVKGAIEKVLALDKAYPLPLLGGAMLEKFPSKFEPARWWPSPNYNLLKNGKVQLDNNNNGWNMELEREMREVVEVVKRKDKEEYERLGNLALKMNKGLAISGPLLTGIAALGCVAAFLGGDNNNNGAMVGVVGGAMAAVVNAIENGGQVGMVFEMYRNCGGFFQVLEEEVEATLEENDLDKRENGELFEMNMALKLGRSVSQLRQLASLLPATHIDEFASKLF